MTRNRSAVSLHLIGLGFGWSGVPALLLNLLPGPALGQANYTPSTFTTLAGTPSTGSADGPADDARFWSPQGVATDAAGNLYVADTWNQTIRRIAPDGTVTTLAGRAGFRGSADGSGTDARFDNPSGIATDMMGNVYVADYGGDVYHADYGGCTIRKITPAGVVTTLAGLAGSAGSDDGIGSAARFNHPTGVAVDAAGNVYVADFLNDTIRRITPDGVVTTLAGLAGNSGSLDDTGSAARFWLPRGLAVNAAGNVYVADAGNATIRKIAPGGVVTTLAGTAGGHVAYGTTGDGTGSEARFMYVASVATDLAGNVYVADGQMNNVRRITPDGVVTTLAGGTVETAGSADGTGCDARFDGPYGVTVDAAGNVNVADTLNHAIRRISANGVVTTLAGPRGNNGAVDGTGPAARFWLPTGIAIDGTGTVYISDAGNCTIRKITAAGSVTTVAGSPRATGYVDGIGSDARFNGLAGLAVDTAGNVYVADSSNWAIRKITPAGTVATLLNSHGFVVGDWNPAGVAVDGAGNLYFTHENSTIWKVTPAGEMTSLAGFSYSFGSADGVGAAARFNWPEGVTVDGSGTLYVADTHNHTIRKVTLEGVVTTLAGRAGNPGSADGVGNLARFRFPTGVALDSAGNVYVADTGNNLIRRVTAGGMVTTLGGVAPIYLAGDIVVRGAGSTDGTGSAARFNAPYYIAIDASGAVYVTDADNNTVRKGQPAAAPAITTQPQSQTVTAGASVHFSVTASGTPTPTYQWYFNGSPFSGATTNTLSFASARAIDAGDYTVVVTNELGSVTSSAATLTVIAATAGLSGGGGSKGGGAMESWVVVMLTLLGAARWSARKSQATC